MFRTQDSSMRLDARVGYLDGLERQARAFPTSGRRRRAATSRGGGRRGSRLFAAAVDRKDHLPRRARRQRQRRQ